MKQFRLALLARDIKNSVTPAAYSAFAKDIGVDIRYTIYNFEIEEIEEKISFCRENLDGFTVTMPYKKTVMQYADSLNASAAACLSCNTMLVKDKKLTAFNTDGWGFIKHLSLENINVAGKTAVMVGAGGVAFSIAYYLRENNIKNVRVLNIIREEGESLCAAFGEKFCFSLLNRDNVHSCCADADFFINASVLGQIGYPDYESFDFIDTLSKEAVVYDVNYSKGESKLLLEAAKNGHRALNGSSMSICQGLRAMEIWTGLRPRDQCAQEVIRAHQTKAKEK
jgi:shikimate dehydrogenase